MAAQDDKRMIDLMDTQTLTVVWAAFVAMVDDVHAPQDQLDDGELAVADRLRTLLTNEMEIRKNEAIGTSHAYIDYQLVTGKDPVYEQVRVDLGDGGGTVVWHTGDPVADWASLISYLRSSWPSGPPVIFGSCLTDFVMDVPGYGFIEDDRGIEMMVKV